MQVPRRTRPLLGFNLTGDLGPFTIYTSRRAGTVWFLKSPPKKPPTIHQIRQRNAFHLAARAWQTLPQEKRDDFNLAAARAHLHCSGYNLWIWWQLKRLTGPLSTIERHARTKLA